MREENGRIIIEPIHAAPVFRLDDLLDALTPEVLHEAVDFGPLQGKEAF